MQFQKLQKGIYEHHTNGCKTGWFIYEDDQIDGSNKWVIDNIEDYQIWNFIQEGNDQLWHTLGEAKEMLLDYLKSI